METSPPAPLRTLDANRLLSTLGRRDRRVVLAACESVELRIGDVLCEPGQPIRHIYFPADGFVSLLVPVDGRDNLEVALIGNEGMLGISLVLGVRYSQLRAVVQGPGSALRMRSAPFCQCLKRVPALRRLLTRYACVLHTQVAQAAACNNFHTLNKRFASCLLAAQDRSNGRYFRLTQAVLGQLLGVRRVGVTNAAGALQKRRLIQYHRGRITILDRRGLENEACGCHQAAKDAYERILG